LVGVDGTFRAYFGTLKTLHHITIKRTGRLSPTPQLSLPMRSIHLPRNTPLSHLRLRHQGIEIIIYLFKIDSRVNITLLLVFTLDKVLEGWEVVFVD
jgi:hypothetical protein